MNAPANQRIIRISGGCIFISPEECLPLDQSSLDPNHMRFRPGKEFYWLTEIISYNPETAGVTLRVLNYFAEDISDFEKQKIRRPIRFVDFEKLDWHQLETQLAFYKSSQILHIIAEETDHPENNDLDTLLQDTDQDTKIEPVGSLSVFEAYTPEPVRETLIESFKQEFTDAVFDIGCVRLVKNFRWYREPVTFTIENSYILPEFDLIKSFFHKVFDGLRKFEVRAMIELVDGSISRVIATSPQIAAINETLIEGVKRAQVLQYIKQKPSVSDKSLFTADEFMDFYAGDEKTGNALNQSEIDILMASLGRQELRNRRQIEYLAGRLQSPKQKIRFTLNPNFGFVFFIEGKTMSHFCWELLNSHATYLWSFGKTSGTAESHFTKVETIIASIRDTGRDQYKSSYNYLPPDPNMQFSIITHRNIDSGLIDGFPEWKHRLLERLV